MSSFHTFIDANFVPILAANVYLVCHHYSQMHVIFLKVQNRPYLRRFSKEKCHEENQVNSPLLPGKEILSESKTFSQLQIPTFHTFLDAKKCKFAALTIYPNICHTFRKNNASENSVNIREEDKYFLGLEHTYWQRTRWDIFWGMKRRGDIPFICVRAAWYLIYPPCWLRTCLEYSFSHCWANTLGLLMFILRALLSISKK